MAKSRNNVVTEGLSGMLARQIVFRQRAGQTIVGKAPRSLSESKPSTTATSAKVCPSSFLC